MTDTAAIITVQPTPEGVELHAVAAGQRVVLRLDSPAGLTLADEITMACERKLEAVAA